MANIWGRFFGKKEEKKFIHSDVPLSVLERGTAAKHALNNPIWNEVFDELIKEAWTFWVRSSAHDVQEREALWKHVKGLYQLRGRLERYVSDALFEEEKIRRQAR